MRAEIAACTQCSLAWGRVMSVHGEGPDNARIMFIGEAPGWHENQQGRPFVGPAGQFLEELLASIGLKRQDVFIANVVKCRPPNNRDPLPAEIAACDPFLERQIAVINPRVIVTLGRYSMAKFFPGESISKIHGVPRRQDGRIVFPMYHPAAALHQPALRQTILADIQKLPAILAEDSRREDRATSPPGDPPPTDAVQLTLF
ncbi:MAG: uracil-DNA glycosylase [Chloroflexi bacterium]|nr:uracil-DNA glycosylase [Chloroflexota bacterium]